MEPYVVLARRYRPRTFDEVLGQEASARTLVRAIQAGRVAHAYLFAGPRGVGKTSMARILARALCCSATDGPSPQPCHECAICQAVAKGEDIDVIEIDGASNRGIEEVRALRDNALFAPARARLKIYIIDEVHMLTDAAFNALLKILEEPPAHVKFVFATTEPQKVPATIRSRCQRFDFRRIPTRTIAGHLAKICEQEGVEAGEEVLFGLARACQGGMRDAQSVLDQLITLGEGTIREEDLERLLGTVSSVRMEEILRAVGEGEEDKALEAYASVHDQGIDAAEFLKQALETARNMLVLLTCGDDTELVDLTTESRRALAGTAKSWGPARVMYGMGLMMDTFSSAKAIGEGRALVELALVKLARAGDLLSLDEILADLKDLQDRIGPGDGRPAPALRGAPGGAEKDGPDPALFRDAEDVDGVLKGEESPGLTREGVQAAWPRVVELVRDRSSAAGSYLAPGVVVGLTDHSVTVGFPAALRFQRSQLDDSDNIRLVEGVIAEVLRSPLKLTTVISEQAVGAQAEDGAPGEEFGAAEEITGAEMERVRAEPIVRALKDLFMARLIHVERT